MRKTESLLPRHPKHLVEVVQELYKDSDQSPSFVFPRHHQY